MNVLCGYITRDNMVDVREGGDPMCCVGLFHSAQMLPEEL